MHLSSPSWGRKEKHMKSPFVTATIALVLAAGGVAAAQSKSEGATPPHEATTHATSSTATGRSLRAISVKVSVLW